MWLILSLLTALFTALSSMFSKVATRRFNRYFLLMLSPFVASLILFPLSTPEINNNLFFLYLFLATMLSFISSWLMLWAIEHGELSKVFPLVNLTPLFMIFTGWIFLGEVPALKAVPGILLIVAGAGFLHMDIGRQSWISSIKTMFKEKGSLAMLAVSLIWSLTGVVDKLGILTSNSGFWAACVKMSVALAATMNWIRFRVSHSGEGAVLKIPMGQTREEMPLKKWAILLLPSLCAVVLLLSSFKAYTLTKVIYVISVKRLSSIFVILFGRFLFKEKGFHYRFMGGVLMLAGVLIIAFWG